MLSWLSGYAMSRSGGALRLVAYLSGAADTARRLSVGGGVCSPAWRVLLLVTVQAVCGGPAMSLHTLRV